MKVILFDLDGTIINSQEGITNSVRYALREICGKEEPDIEKLKRFIGPPLEYSFQKEYGYDNETIQKLVEKYRERYSVKGAYESELYPEVMEMLPVFREKGYRLGIASSKPEEFCKKILQYLKADHYFEHITGSDMEGRRNTKAAVLKESLERFQINKEDAILIGDTRFDAEGAALVDMKCIGITYGFGCRKEMEAAKAVVLDTLKEAEVYLAGI